ncbi:MAG: hypothetical protein WAK82_27120 [Streptosporangiaceae bacterium]
MPQCGRDRDRRRASTATMPPRSRRATTTPAPAVRVSRSPACQPRTPQINWPVTRPEASTRLTPYTASSGTTAELASGSGPPSPRRRGRTATRTGIRRDHGGDELAR